MILFCYFVIQHSCVVEVCFCSGDIYLFRSCMHKRKKKPNLIRDLIFLVYLYVSLSHLPAEEQTKSRPLTTWDLCQKGFLKSFRIAKAKPQKWNISAVLQQGEKFQKEKINHSCGDCVYMSRWAAKPKGYMSWWK